MALKKQIVKFTTGNVKNATKSVKCSPLLVRFTQFSSKVQQVQKPRTKRLVKVTKKNGNSGHSTTIVFTVLYSSLQRTHRAANKMVVSGDGDDDVHSVAKKYMTHTPSYFAVLLFSLNATNWAMLPLLLLFDSVFFPACYSYSRSNQIIQSP